MKIALIHRGKVQETVGVSVVVVVLVVMVVTVVMMVAVVGGVGSAAAGFVVADSVVPFALVLLVLFALQGS